MLSRAVLANAAQGYSQAYNSNSLSERAYEAGVQFYRKNSIWPLLYLADRAFRKSDSERLSAIANEAEFWTQSAGLGNQCVLAHIYISVLEETLVARQNDIEALVSNGGVKVLSNEEALALFSRIMG